MKRVPTQQFDNQAWVEGGGQAAWAAGSYQNQQAFPPLATPVSALQTPFPQPGQMWQSASTPPPTPTSTPVGVAIRGSGNNSPYMMPTQRTPGAMYFSPAPTMRPKARRTSNLGFMVAALCVISGGLLLVFVYVMALGLPAHNTTSADTQSPAATMSHLTTPTAAAPSPTVVLSPTAGGYAGQQYIDNPQMASMVNLNTAQPLQTTTTFKANQKIYVTFTIHPNGKNGAVCLYWYLNNRSVTQFPFAVNASARAGYSYAIYGGTGPAYVEIYWASTTTCSDRILAQHVVFTVTK